MDAASDPNPNNVSNVESASASAEYPQTNFKPSPEPNEHVERVSDLLVSVLICSDLYKPKIVDLAVEAAEELRQMATEKQPLWYDDGQVLNMTEYNRKFAPLDPTLDEIIRMIAVADPTELPNYLGENFGQLPCQKGEQKSAQNGSTKLKTEASRAAGFVLMQPIKLVEMFLDVEQWLIVFSNIITKANVLGVLSAGKDAQNPNGTLQVISAKFHVPSPLVSPREFYFARYCKQLDDITWLVVDFSLDSIFPNPVRRFRRRPSGCLIRLSSNGLTKVVWVEHNEVDDGSVHEKFRPLLTSGYAFTAKRWLATMERQCDRLTVLLEDNSALRDGRKSILQLAHRMTRSFNTMFKASEEKMWQRLPLGNDDEEILMKTGFNLDDPGSPTGFSLTFTASIWLPIPPKDVFEFLRSGTLRDKWDILSYGKITRDLAHFSTSRDPANRVSIILVEEAPKKAIIHYLQESFTDSTGYYIVYAPIDIPALNMLFDGGNPAKVSILGSGFTVLPIRPTSYTCENYASVLTITFQIVEERLVSPEYVPPHSVELVYNIVKKTVALIKAGLMPPNVV